MFLPESLMKILLSSVVGGVNGESPQMDEEIVKVTFED